jgi:hypothetical protein
MSGAIPPLPQNAFMAYCSVKSTGTTLPLSYLRLCLKKSRQSILKLNKIDLLSGRKKPEACVVEEECVKTTLFLI